MPKERKPSPTTTFGRAGRKRAAQEPARLAAAGFLGMLRLGGSGGGADSELVGGLMRKVEPLRGAGATAIRGLGVRLAAAAERAEALRSAESPGVGWRLEVVARPLVRLGPEDVLRPSLALVRRAAPSSHAGAAQRLGAGGSLDPGEVALAVEVPPEAPARRRGGAEALVVRRLSAYARAPVREVWLLNVERGWVEAYRSPWGGAFRSRTLWYPGEEVPVTAAPGLAVEAMASL